MIRPDAGSQVSTRRMTSDPQAPASLADVTDLRHSGIIKAGEYLQRVQQCRDAAYWRLWALRALLALGAAHVLAGVVFFFAYNWDDLSPYTRFGILQAAIAASFGTALLLRLDRPGGQAMLIAASVLTGVLFAVIGQVYQTGADAWELFTAWSVLILPWVLASRSAAHWLLWIVILLMALALYGAQVLVALGTLDAATVATVVGVLPVIFLTIRELALRHGHEWLDGNWLRRTLVVLSLAVLFPLALAYVFANDEAPLGFVSFVLVAAALATVYLKYLPDFAVLAIVVALVSLLGMAIGGRVIFDLLDNIINAGTLVLGLLLLGAWCVLVTTAVVRLLNHLNRRFRASSSHG